MQFTYNIPPNLARALAKGTVSRFFFFFSPKTLSVQLIQVTWGGGNIQSIMVKELMAPSVHLVRVGFVGVYVIRVCRWVWEWGW